MTRQEGSSEDTLSREANEVIHKYSHIRAGQSLAVRCPYYRNPRSGERKWGLIVFSGKGSPEEIENELRMIEKLEDLKERDLNYSSVIQLMRKYRLGVDCAGFVFHVLDAENKSRTGRSLLSRLHPSASSWFSKFSWIFRPLTHVSVKLLTSPQNAEKIHESKLMPGDCIAFFGDIDHVAIVTSVKRASGDIYEVKYAHAAFEESGGMVKEGVARYRPGLGFSDASLIEDPETRKVLTDGRKDPVFFRLRVFITTR